MFNLALELCDKKDVPVSLSMKNFAQTSEQNLDRGIVSCELCTCRGDALRVVYEDK